MTTAFKIQWQHGDIWVDDEVHRYSETEGAWVSTLPTYESRSAARKAAKERNDMVPWVYRRPYRTEVAS